MYARDVFAYLHRNDLDKSELVSHTWHQMLAKMRLSLALRSLCMDLVMVKSACLQDGRVVQRADLSRQSVRPDPIHVQLLVRSLFKRKICLSSPPPQLPLTARFLMVIGQRVSLYLRCCVCVTVTLGVTHVLDAFRHSTKSGSFRSSSTPVSTLSIWTGVSSSYLIGRLSSTLSSCWATCGTRSSRALLCPMTMTKRPIPVTKQPDGSARC